MSEAPVETEIKLLFEPGLRPRLEQHPAFAHAVRAAPRRELSTYFDTDGLVLHRHGYSLRIREAGGELVQTLKKAPSDGAVHERNEWEWKLSQRRLALRPLDRAIAADAELNGGLRGATSKFVTEIQRRRFDIRLDSSRVEAAIDEGVVRVGDREEPVCEVELEIKDGPPGPAYRLALDLIEHNPFRIGVESKAERGYRLLTGIVPPPVAARAAPVQRRAALGEALNWTAGAALHPFVANMSAARMGDPEAVHQMRVALRRLRTMLVLYAPFLDPEASERFSNSIRDTGAVLGAARDWDVFVGQTLSHARDAGVRAEWTAALEEGATAKQEDARRGVRALIDGKAPGELVLGIEAWLCDPEAAAKRPKSARVPIADIIPDLLDRLAEKVARRGRRVTHSSPPELHRLRKSIKKMRYSVESASALYPGKAVNRYVKRCKKLQTALGTINDSQVTIRLVEEIAPSHSAAWAPAAGAMLKWNAERLKDAERDLARAWRKLRHSDRVWR
ncbi:MAG TPA: CYTH and CHAD domain-containing protein [Rhizomicrobium sp.]|nr:CYTH and CHAD domain-containing protein [Rhizomicrobium sp.]